MFQFKINFLLIVRFSGCWT